MKGVKDLILDDSPKNVKKLEKLLKDPASASYLDAARAEAANSTAMEFPKFRMMVTDSFVCYSRIGIAGEVVIIPISTITNVYRTCIVRNEYEFEQFTLAVETTGGLKYLANFPRTGAKSLDIFNDVISAIKAKMTVSGGVQ